MVSYFEKKKPKRISKSHMIDYLNYKNFWIFKKNITILTFLKLDLKKHVLH